MHKITLTALFCIATSVVAAQKETSRFNLKMQREVNGTTHIIDTSFENKSALHDYLETLEPSHLRIDSLRNRRVYRHKATDDKQYAEMHLFLADSLYKHRLNGHSYSFSFPSDSLHRSLMLHLDSNLGHIRSFHFPEGHDSSFYNFNWNDHENMLALRTYKHAFPGFERQGRKKFEFKKLVEAEKSHLPVELKAKLNESNPPLELEGLKVFPNPGDGLVQLSFKVVNTATLKIRVLNAAGISIFYETLPAFSGVFLTEIDLRNAGKGTYYVYVLHGKKSALRKLIIQ